MSKSIMQSNKVCCVTGDTRQLHKHHVFGGCRRAASEKWGCWVWLRADWHNMADYGVHFNHELDAKLKAECQEKFEYLHGHEAFMAVFGKNYMDAAERKETKEPAGGSFAVIDGPELPF